MADRIFYTIYRFFEEIHGPGDSAEVAALFTWTFLLAINVGTVLVLVIATVGMPTMLQGRTSYAFGAIGLVVAASQYFRYLTSDKIGKLHDVLSREPKTDRMRRRWTSFAYAIATVTAFCASLWLLSVLR